MRGLSKVVLLSLFVIGQQSYAQELLCKLQQLQLVGNTIEVRFAAAANWNVNEHALSPEVYLRDGKLFYIPDGENRILELGPVRLKHGECLALHVPHHPCNLQTVIGKVSTGIIVRQGFTHPGIRTSSDYDFLPAVRRQ